MTGGFKVWHIIFIIIAFVVTIIVVYCCFHRCRIPRTKQEIEADLMRTNLANKFRDYLQEFPNEPTSFLEALKKVQELEEKSSEQDDPGARKRMGWLKLKGKEKHEKSDATKEGQDKTSTEKDAKAGAETAPVNGLPATSAAPDKGEPVGAPQDADVAAAKSEPTKPDPLAPQAARLKPFNFGFMDRVSEKGESKGLESKPEEVATKAQLAKPAKPAKPATSKGTSTVKGKEAKLTKGEKVLHDGEPSAHSAKAQPDDRDKTVASKSQTPRLASGSANRLTRVRRRKDKPNLSRSKATHLAGSRDESTDNQNQLNLPAPSRHHHHHHGHAKPGPAGETKQVAAGEDGRTNTIGGLEDKQVRGAKSKPSRTPKAPKESTVIQIGSTPEPAQP